MRAGLTITFSKSHYRIIKRLRSDYEQNNMHENAMRSQWIFTCLIVVAIESNYNNQAIKVFIENEWQQKH